MKELNEKGLRQAVEQSIQLNDGTIVTIDGIVSDTNRVIVYYREENKEHPLHDYFSFNKIEGFLTNTYFSSGSSQTNNDSHQCTGMAIFEAVSTFAKKLALSIRDNDSGEQYTLNFPYNANKAIPITLKHALNHKFKTDTGIISVQHIISTGASTLITGKFNQSIDRYLNSTININLYADGKLIPWQQNGINSFLFGGDNFEVFYDAIPANTKKLEIKLENFNAYEKVANSFAIEKEATYKVGFNKLRMIDITQQNNQTLITIASEHNIAFDQVS